jgi:hypothetical protein
MRRLDVAGNTELEPLTGDQIRATREQARISQAVFAHYLNRDRGEPHGSSPPTPPYIRVTYTAVR